MKGLIKEKTDDDVNIHIKRKHLGEGELQLDSKKLKKAIENEAKRRARLSQEETDDRKRPYNSAFMSKGSKADTEVTEEELEAYRLKKSSYVF